VFHFIAIGKTNPRKVITGTYMTVIKDEQRQASFFTRNHSQDGLSELCTELHRTNLAA